METLLIILGGVLFIIFCVKISAPSKKSRPTQPTPRAIPPQIVSEKIETWTDEEGKEYRHLKTVWSNGEIVYSSPNGMSNAEWLELEKSRDENPNAKTDIPLPDYLKQPDNFNIKIRFSDYKGSKFDALKESYPSLAKETDGKYSLDFSYDKLKEVKDVFDKVKSYKEAEFYIGGNSIDKKYLSEILQCLTNKTKNGKPCWCDRKDDLGGCSTLACRRMSIGFGYHRTWNYHIKEGPNGFIVDTEKLEDIFKKEGEAYRHCPYFRPKYAWERFLKIPKEISFNDKRWLCLKYKTGELAAEPRNPKELLKEVLEYTDLDQVDKVLSKE